jgi:hypothetical protein
MGGDDLARDRQAQARMLAELLALGTRAVEALEDPLEARLRDARPLVGDGDLHHPADARGGERDPPARRAERHGVGDQVAQHLPEPVLDARDAQRLARRQVEVE